MNKTVHHASVERNYPEAQNTIDRAVMLVTQAEARDDPALKEPKVHNICIQCCKN